MSLAAIQLRDAVQALECGRDTLAAAIRTLETAGPPPDLSPRAAAAAECARIAAEISAQHARIALVLLAAVVIAIWFSLPPPRH